MSDRPIELISDSVERTIELGRAIGAACSGGELIALIGELATGKTHLTKGISLGLNVPDANAITSPTFTLVNEYQGRLHMYHIDAYRLESPAELEVLGFYEFCSPGAVVLVEWADRVWGLLGPCEPIRIELAHRGPTERAIKLSNLPEAIAIEMERTIQ